MKITVLCTDPNHPVVPHLRRWQSALAAGGGHTVEIVHDKKEAAGGDILFLVSCSQLVGDAERRRYRAILVLHASDLPKGRGWSPYIWSIVNGESEITVCLLDASDPVDSGDVWLRKKFTLEGHEVLAEINSRLFATELELMTQAIEQFDHITPVPQAGHPGAPLPKRTPEHSRLDPHKTIAEQFDVLRVADPVRYPAFMDFRGNRYLLRIEKAEGDEPH